jgi:NADH:ubiquinone oxidoreductase subunit 6 (subunit J)
MSVEAVLFWIFALIICGSSVAVVVSQNVVRMAFWLVLSLGSVAALFFLLGADFLGATQLLIYVGGTVVLLVFGVMLTASGPYLQIKTSPAEMFLGAGVGGLLLMVLGFSVVGINWNEDVVSRVDASKPRIVAEIDQAGGTARPLGLAFLGLRPDRAKLSEEGKSDRAGYLLPFEIVSIHLLVVLVGAAYLARAKRRVEQ